MHLVYIDEVKYNPDNEPYHWLCALAIPQDQILSIENELHAISAGYFGNTMLDVSSEFHAEFIVQGKGPCKGWPIWKRLDLLKALADIIASHPTVGRIVVRLNPEHMQLKDCPKVAFMFVVEKIEQLMRARSSIALLISDLDKQYVNHNVRNLSKYKTDGTDYSFGQKILNLVDTVHHTHSHHSRLLQLADVFAYSVALSHKIDLKYLKQEYLEHIKALNNFLSPTKYKYWPKAYTWH